MTQVVEPGTQDAATDERQVMVFSSDNHVGPRLKEDLRQYCPAKYLSAFDDYANSPFGDAVRNREINEPAYSDAYINGRRRNLETAGHYDAHTFVRDMDHERISGAVIFHQSLNGQPFPLDVSNSFGQGAPSRRREGARGCRPGHLQPLARRLLLGRAGALRRLGPAALLGHRRRRQGARVVRGPRPERRQLPCAREFRHGAAFRRRDGLRSSPRPPRST